MAYMSKEKKAILMPEIKKVLKKYGVKATFRVRHHSTLICTIRGGEIDFTKFYTDHSDHGTRSAHVNVYHIESSWDGIAKDFLLELKEAMMVGNHDRSDIMTDYFDVGWYIDIDLVEKYTKPFEAAA